MTLLSVALMCHPSRKRFVDELVEPLPEAEVVWDRENSRWDTGRRSLLSFDPSADFHLVVQDDAVICRDFIVGAERVAAATDGTRPIGLYTGKVKPHRHTVTPAVEKALATGAPWISMWGPWWGVAIILPTAHIPKLVAWGDGHPEIQNYDRRVARWYERQDIKCWYTVPSLVDHRPVDENPSLIPDRTANRQAHAFIGDRSPLDIDWSLEPVEVPATQRFRHIRQNRTIEVAVGSGRHRNLMLSRYWYLDDEQLEVAA